MLVFFFQRCDAAHGIGSWSDAELAAYFDNEAARDRILDGAARRRSLSAGARTLAATAACLPACATAGPAAFRPLTASESVTGVESFDHAGAAALLHPSAPDAAANSSTPYGAT